MANLLDLSVYDMNILSDIKSLFFFIFFFFFPCLTRYGVLFPTLSEYNRSIALQRTYQQGWE